MQRRQFLGTVAASAVLGRIARAESLPADLKITRIVSFDLHTRRAKFVGKNAVRGDHGQHSRDRMARLYTNMGVEGVGRCWKPEEALAPLLGKNPFEEFDLASRKMPGPLGNWSSLLSLFMQVHVGLVIPNFYRAEHDPLKSDLLIADGYQIADGVCSVPDAPGFGLTIDESRFERARVNFELRA